MKLEVGLVFEAPEVSTPDQANFHSKLSDLVPERGVPDGFSVD
jgi:hypothetical protein